MSTCFFPVAADLAPGDEVTAVGDVAFASPRTVTSREVRDGVVAVEFEDGSTLTLPLDADVRLAPPF